MQEVRYSANQTQIKAARPKLRQQFINEGRMNPEGQMRLSDSVKLYGICEDMCPEYERVRRIHEDDVLPPECVRDSITHKRPLLLTTIRHPKPNTSAVNNECQTNHEWSRHMRAQLQEPMWSSFLRFAHHRLV